MISREVSVMVPTGRIVVIIGSDQRYMTSLRLITRFINDYYRKLIYQYLRRDFGQDAAFQLETTELIIGATAHFFFEELGQVLIEQKLEPIIETLEHSFKEFFAEERGEHIQNLEIVHLNVESQLLYAELLK